MGRNSGRLLGLVAAMLLLLQTSDASAGPASDTLRARQEELYGLLRQAHRNPQKIHSALDSLLDLETMCATSLGGHWSVLSEGDRRHYKDICGQIIRRTYTSDLMATRNHEVRFVGERAGDGTVTVETLVVSRDWPDRAPREVTYVMGQRQGAWKVVDIVDGGRSVVQSQRIAYARSIARNGFAVLMRKLEYIVSSGADPI
jgi:ABC-type transporter MlaC component